MNAMVQHSLSSEFLGKSSAHRTFLRLLVCVVLLSGLSHADEPVEQPAKFNAVLKLGQVAPGFEDIPGVDGKKHGLKEYAAARCVVIIFTCHHCPVASRYQARLEQLVRETRERRVQVIAISVSLQVNDRLPRMQARAAKTPFPYPYLCDETQRAGQAYGAYVTPHCFVLDARRRVAYMGAFDDHIEPGKVTRKFVAEAVEACLDNRLPAVRESLPRGCDIEYLEDRRPATPTSD